MDDKLYLLNSKLYNQLMIHNLNTGLYLGRDPKAVREETLLSLESTVVTAIPSTLTLRKLISNK